MIIYKRCAFAFIVMTMSVLGCNEDAVSISPVSPWRTAPPLPERRFEGFAAASKGKIYYLGGITGVVNNLASIRESDHVDIYDPKTATWSPGPTLPADGPKHHLAVAVINDEIYILGGFVGVVGGEPPGKFSPNGATYVLRGDTWTRLADQPLPRGAATAQAIDGKIYVTGGGDYERHAYPQLFRYDPVANAWAQLAGMPTERQHVASCTLSGKLLVFGGWFSEAQETVGAAQLYDPSTNEWTSLQDLSVPRGGLGAAVVGDRCFAIGGEEWNGPLLGTFGTAEALTLARPLWQPLPEMPTRRHGIGVAVLDGEIYVVGGGPIRGNSYTDQVEVLHP